MFESGYFAGRAVAGHDDLLPGFVEGIEGMKELLLDTLFAGQKLNVINQQGLHPAVFIPEFGQLVFLKGCDELIGEALAGHVGDSPAGLLCCIDFMSDGMEQVSFPEANASEQKQWIEGLTRVMGDSSRSAVGKLVVIPDDKGRKGVIGTQHRLARTATGWRIGYNFLLRRADH